MMRKSRQNSAKMVLMTDERYAFCPFWKALVRPFSQDLVAIARDDSSLGRIFPELETLWYRPAAGVELHELTATLRRLHENNADIDLVLCLDAAEEEHLEAYFSLGVRDIIFLDELRTNLRAVHRVLAALRQRRSCEAQQKAALASLKQALRSKAESLVWLSHEIRTPLNGLLGLIELLQVSALDSDQREMLDMMSRCGSNMVELVSDVLDLSKLEASKMQLSKKPFALRRLLNDCQGLYTREAQKRGIQLTTVVAPEVPAELLGDERKLAQIINNLLSNAVKYTQQGRVQVAVYLDNEMGGKVTLRIEVKDTGFGISQEQRPLIFAAFAQTDSRQLSDQASTGVGLHLTKQLVELMGGQISFHSELGHGTTFEAILPFSLNQERSKEKVTASPTPLRIQRESKLGLGKHILVVDDDPFNLKVATRQLHRLASQVTVARSGLEALELMEKNDYDLVFLDCQMPHMDGSEFLHILRRSPERRHPTPVIALTGLAQSDDRKRILEEGFDDYLAKPAQIDDIRQMLEKWLKASPEEAA